jgi:hypothetical protein
MCTVVRKYTECRFLAPEAGTWLALDLTSDRTTLLVLGPGRGPIWIEGTVH